MAPSALHLAFIESIFEESADVKTYRFAICPRDGKPFKRAMPGQFNMLYVPGVGESAISVCGSVEDGQSIDHMIRAVGNVTRAIDRLAVGDTIGIRGPFGSQWPVSGLCEHDVVIVAGGLGLPPLRPLVRAITAHQDRYEKVHLFIGSRTPEGILFADEFDQWRDVGVDVRTTVDEATHSWNGNVGVVTRLMNDLVVRDRERTSLLTCGPEIMMKFAARSMLAKGARRKNLHLSLERHMNCGVGTCGHCQHGPYFLCKDGPVLSYAHVKSLLAIKDL